MRTTTTTKQLFPASSSQSCLLQCLSETWTAKSTSTRQVKATTVAHTCHCQPSRRRFRMVFFGRRPLPTTLLQIMQPSTPPQARNRLSPGTIKCTHSLLGFEDPLPSECSGPPCIGANPIRQVRMPPTSDSPVHSFETCIPAWIACSQPGEWHHPRAHLLLPTSRRGRVPVTERSQTTTEAPAALKISHLLGTSNRRGISKT